MKTSTDRILTTHVGSLPRPRGLVEQLIAKHRGEDAVDTLESEVDDAVEQVVATQVASGIDVVNDGEMSKFSYTFYVKDRIRGLTVSDTSGARNFRDMAGRDILEHPDFMERFLADTRQTFTGISFPLCSDEVSYGDLTPLTRDIDRLTRAAQKKNPVDIFMTAASPGVLVRFIANKHYPTEEEYLAALAEAMKTEYTEIAKRGVVLQIDCPDLASSRNNLYKDKSDDEFLKIVERNIEMLNYATDGIPGNAMRLHICWGNYLGPHTHDIPLLKILPACLRARPSAISFEGANPRHDHEWEDLAGLKIPSDKILIPGVIDSTTNFVEHPRLVAQRILRYADIVGRDRVIAGADCGFGTFATMETVAPSIVWAKLRALADGARLASQRLW